MSIFDKLFYGSVTVCERGQVVIPSKARREKDIEPGDKLLVFGHPVGHGLIFLKVDTIQEFLGELSSTVKKLEEHIREDDNDR